MMPALAQGIPDMKKPGQSMSGLFSSAVKSKLMQALDINLRL
jgi:hypothetical protein